MLNKLKLGIRSKITLGYIIIILCLLASVIILNNQITSLQKERNFIIKYDSNVKTLTNDIEKYILDMESSQRAFIITGEPSYLEPYDNGAENWKIDFNDLYQQMKDKPTQQEKLKEIEETIDHWVETTGGPTIQYKKDGNTKALTEFFKVDNGRQDMEKMRKLFDAFRATENTYTQAKAAQLDKQNSQLTSGLFGILILVSVIAIVIASGISRSIVKTITEVTQTIQEMAATKGDFKRRIHVNTNDEINELADATNILLESVEKREWLQTNIADIVTKYQGISAITKLAETFLSEMAQKTQASLGAFYVREEAEEQVLFIKKAAFADGDDRVGMESFKVGQGLIGQCALEKRVLFYDNIPQDYRLIRTGLGEIRPKHILLIPVIFENEVIAVVELATMTKFNALQQELVKQVTETFGLTVNGVLGRMEIVRLLNESRAMTEELQVQSEELQTQSEELQMQTEELTMINEQLEERTKEAESKSRELEKAKQELEESAEQLILNSNYKSEFLANMSHELRTPLNSILILSEMLAENSQDHLTDEETEFAKVIHSSGEDLLALINDILDLSKVEAGKLDIIFNEVNMSEVPVQIEHTFAPVAMKKNIDFHISKADHVVDVFYTDEKRFQQIIKNLLSNAFKFTEHGSVTLAINQLAQSQLTSNMQDISDDWLEITVSDTGIGIPKDKHQLIFESFQQADGATVRKYGGTGLGLSICKEFAKLLGGWITLQSEEGQGSSFTLTIPSLPNGVEEDHCDKLAALNEVAVTIEEDVPREEPSQDNREVLKHDEVEVFQGKNILIVDDDNRNIYALKTALETRGMNILVAKDGLECLEVLQAHHEIDLVLMDIMMPNMDGYEAMTIIRQQMKRTELPIIALTAKAMKNDRDKSLQAGASDYISKPLNLDQLISVLRVWLVSKGSI
ncbi:ATP-binding protein [Lysinibacillus sp. fkY74-1]|uniref:Circadian input-output histidine kinase CikA n=3 Tax=Lysinibacillus TaxID=400634 RepID=W7RVU9_LYSSH|nr:MULTISPECIES: ATP-binding protein [Lysinibacillus]MBE5086041.1 response regulator [Bacillus thuringiensis]ACA42146.1 two component system histidine kinase [Lysinibacillus sphaericus C3-41]AMO31600.1 hybrid sensor histidine kinase/response regulator [Lysinibacillus sphaericus]AMR89285.1 hybrid sensor histidine kinase/response regulator [Lysinibacillus sphaericus]ANA47356.1 hybrid sensor histidine kinase/response regulator [Lysinibacillus sphaericus]